MNISDEAVEAAVEAHCEGTMRAALEAAAPYLAESAFVRGYRWSLADRGQARSRRAPRWSRKHRSAGR
jgi:hypothetical protein